MLGETLPYDNIQEIRGRLNQVSPNLTRYGLVEEANFFAQAAELAAMQKKLALAKDPIDVSQKLLTDYYMTDTISRASPTMAKCVQAVKQSYTGYTDGYIDLFSLVFTFSQYCDRFSRNVLNRYSMTIGCRVWCYYRVWNINQGLRNEHELRGAKLV